MDMDQAQGMIGLYVIHALSTPDGELVGKATVTRIVGLTDESAFIASGDTDAHVQCDPVNLHYVEDVALACEFCHGAAMVLPDSGEVMHVNPADATFCQVFHPITPA